LCEMTPPFPLRFFRTRFFFSPFWSRSLKSFILSTLLVCSTGDAVCPTSSCRGDARIVFFPAPPSTDNRPKLCDSSFPSVFLWGEPRAIQRDHEPKALPRVLAFLRSPEIFFSPLPLSPRTESDGIPRTLNLVRFVVLSIPSSEAVPPIRTGTSGSRDPGEGTTPWVQPGPLPQRQFLDPCFSCRDFQLSFSSHNTPLGPFWPKFFSVLPATLLVF